MVPATIRSPFAYADPAAIPVRRDRAPAIHHLWIEWPAFALALAVSADHV